MIKGIGEIVMFNGLLPNGSVVLLKNSTRKVMIVGVCQRGVDHPDKVWDYVGVIFPEGFLSADQMFMFDHEQIEQIFALGYQDEEQMEFKKHADAALQDIRGKAE